MKIHFNDIPDEGLSLQGQLSEDLLATDQQHEQFVGPIDYDLHLYLTEDEDVIVTGSLSVPVRMTCARCSEPFDAVHSVDDLQIVLERPKSEEIELDEPLREELLIVLPAYPHCDEEGDRECPGRALIAEINEKSKTDGSPDDPEDDNNKWGALDDLKL